MKVIDNNDGTITIRRKVRIETLTSENGTYTEMWSVLLWQQGGSDEPLAYAEAKEYIKKLNEAKFAGYDDWRFPTRPEAFGIVTEEPNNGLFLVDAFDPKQIYIWTADKKSASSAWFVYFGGGYCLNSDLVFNDFYVRAVR